MNISLYPHPTSLNHGCEAIAISTANILNKYKVGELRLVLTREPTDTNMGDISLLEDLYNIVDYIPLPDIKRFSIDWFKYQIAKIFGRNLGVEIRKSRLKRDINEMFTSSDLFMSIGGDNYCYGRPVAFYALNEYIHHIKKKSVLWGCSIEPSSINEEMRNDLLLYDKIVARESLTYESLKSHGITNVVLYPDPAFTLPLVEPTAGIYNNAIGINVSPMILKYAQDKDLLLDAWKNALAYILKETDMDIVLIPHVTVSTTDDRIILRQLYDTLNCPDRVRLLNDMNCMELKGVISQCRMFIGARTHATIAAYSTCVPTLVCGYSVKAKGISKDLFGTYENYVLPVQEISDSKQLLASMKWLMENEDSIRSHLKLTMPKYIERAWSSGMEIATI